MWRARKISPLVGCFSQVTGSNQFVWMLAFVVSYLVQDAKRPLGGICFAYSLVVHKASAGAASVVRGAVFASAGPLPAPTAHGHSLHQRMAACERRATPCTDSAGPLPAPTDGGLRAQGHSLHQRRAACERRATRCTSRWRLASAGPVRAHAAPPVGSSHCSTILLVFCEPTQGSPKSRPPPYFLTHPTIDVDARLLLSCLYFTACSMGRMRKFVAGRVGNFNKQPKNQPPSDGTTTVPQTSPAAPPATPRTAAATTLHSKLETLNHSRKAVSSAAARAARVCEGDIPPSGKLVDRTSFRLACGKLPTCPSRDELPCQPEPA